MRRLIESLRLVGPSAWLRVGAFVVTAIVLFVLGQFALAVAVVVAALFLLWVIDFTRD